MAGWYKCPSEKSRGSVQRVFLPLGASATCHDVPASWLRHLLPSDQNPSLALRRQTSRTDTQVGISDPRTRAPITDQWDGLARLIGRTKHAVVTKPVNADRSVEAASSPS